MRNGCYGTGVEKQGKRPRFGKESHICRIRGITDLIEHTKGGYLVHGFEPVDYSVKIRRMFTEKDGKSAVPRKERREQMGMWNIEKVKEFSIEVVDRQMRKIYAEVTGEPVG